MMGEFRFAVVDVFTDQPYRGNPAAVVLDASGLSDKQMASIAREFNLSETTFVLPAETPDAAVRFRWFTPGAEVEMCGHATLAGVHALAESGRLKALLEDRDAVLPIQTAGGLLSARMERAPGGSDDRLIWLDLTPPRLRPCPLNTGKLARLLGIAPDDFERTLPIVQTQDGDAIVFVRDQRALQTIRPNFTELAAYQTRQRIRGFCLATTRTLAPSVHVQSRFFCPALGVDEDPVTGSVHGPLAAYLVDNELVPSRDGTAAVSCVQSAATGRAGLVRVLVTARPDGSHTVRIAGQCITTMRGTLQA
ncbi:MAG TPA: PhzF family phenazine biosynthesis protein [Phycisphaerae bacterium]|nr:PhzF family phenazine biosynthesis protein [Phycisphaerae bacterium]